MNRFLWRSILASAFALGLPASLLRASDAPPRLVVGIVVDQMRADYLERFDAGFGDKGFRRLEREGFAFRSMHFNYVPTATGPGHAAVWTGAYPANSGIANNDFFDRASGKMVYCVKDPAVHTVGADGDAGAMSPHRLLVTTVGDELKLASNQRSRVVSISLKDRAAVLPAGHMADAAFWFDYASGNFVTSSFYLEALPDWVKAYNAQNRAAALLAQPWVPRDDASTYTASRSDANTFEGLFPGETAPTFPHDIPAIGAREKAAGDDPYGVLSNVPWGNTLVREMAEAALRETDLGRDAVPDILAVSFSSTDYIGHQFGPASMEVEDTYRRLDDELAHLLRTIDETVGLKHAVIFLTSDHAVSYNSAYLRSLGFSPALTLDWRAFQRDIETALVERFGDGPWVQAIFKNQIVLDREKIRAAGLELSEVQAFVRDFALSLDGVVNAFTTTDLLKPGAAEGLPGLLRRGAHATRSGDVLVVLASGAMFGHVTGTTHGEAHSYDTHVPLLLMGPGIPSGGESYERVVITQIAPTVAALLRITPPTAAYEPILPGLLP